MPRPILIQKVGAMRRLPTGALRNKSGGVKKNLSLKEKEELLKKAEAGWKAAHARIELHATRIEKMGEAIRTLTARKRRLAGQSKR